MRNRIKAYALVLVMLISMMVPAVDVSAATGKTTLAVSAGTLNIGDTVSITAKAFAESGGSAYATMTLSYDASILEFVSCTATYGGGNGSVSVSIDSFTVTLKAIAAGTSGIYLTATDGVEFSSGEELSSMSGSSASITVNNAAGGNTGGGSAGGNTGGNTGGGSTGGSTGGNTGGGSTGGNTGGNTGGGSTGGNTGGSTGGNTAPVLSADNSLKSLVLSAGTLSPAFKYSTVNYKATVPHDVTNIAVSAVASNAKATVESVTGNNNLQVGENVIKIVVKAENGTTATYAIKVTRLAADAAPSDSENQEPDSENTEAPQENGAEGIPFNNGIYRVVEQIPQEIIPKGFSLATVNYHGTDYQGLTFENGTISVFYLAKADLSDPTGIFAIYDETRDLFYPLARLTHGNHYVIPLLAPVDTEIPDTYTNTNFATVDGTSVSAYQLLDEEDAQTKEFYLFYGVNQDGEESWYTYDLREGTYQRTLHAFRIGEGGADSEQVEYLQSNYNKLKEQYREEKASAKTTLYVMIFIIAVLVILLINLFVFFRKQNSGVADGFEEDYEDDYEEDDLDDEEDTGSYKSITPVKRPVNPTKNDIEVFDFNDED